MIKGIDRFSVIPSLSRNLNVLKTENERSSRYAQDDNSQFTIEKIKRIDRFSVIPSLSRNLNVLKTENEKSSRYAQDDNSIHN